MMTRELESSPLTEALRRQALDLLQTRGHRALDDVERLLGHIGPGGMTLGTMAQRLGISAHQLRYLVHRFEYLDQDKERRLAEKRAQTVQFTTHASRQLRFAISLPVGWRVDVDTTAPLNLAPEFEAYIDSAKSAEAAYERLLNTERAKAPAFPLFQAAYARDRLEAYRLFFADLLGMPPDQDLQSLAARGLSAEAAYDRLLREPETFLVGFEVFKAQYDADVNERLMAARRQAGLASMQVGLFQASPPDRADAACVEVSKLRLTTPLTPIELYRMDKPLPKDVPWGARPSKAMVIDGMEGVVYYYLFNTGETNPELPVFFNAYLTDQREGWIISCSCRYGDYYFKTFNKYKPIFRRIVRSFRRIRMVSDRDS